MPKKKKSVKPAVKKKSASLSSVTIAKLRQEIAFLNSIIENIPNMVFLKDAKDLRFVRFNKAGQDLLGYSQKDLLGKNDYDFFPREEADFFTAKDREVLKRKQIADIPEEPIKTRKNGIRILHTKKRGLYDMKGKPAYLLGISEDITEKKESAARLAESEKRLQLALKTSRIGVWSWNIEADSIVWDANMYFLFGVTPKTFTPTIPAFLEIVNKKDRERVGKSIALALENESEFNNDYWINPPNGSPERAIGVRSLIDRDAAGKAVSMTGICWDITEQQKKYGLEIKSQMISMVSHELRTPIHTVKESIAVVLEGLTGQINNEQREVLETAKQCIDRLTRLINNVLNFQKMEAGIVDLHFEKHDINDLIRGIADIEKTAAERKGLTIQLNLSKDALVAEVDSDKIVQVLTNLIHNAIKFTVKGHITISSKKSGKDGVEISVEDTGIGFSEMDIEKIFTEFGQTETARKLFPQGTGLGLAISKKIISQHHGKIWAQTKKHPGSIFHVALPLKQSVYAE